MHMLSIEKVYYRGMAGQQCFKRNRVFNTSQGSNSDVLIKAGLLLKVLWYLPASQSYLFTMNLQGGLKMAPVLYALTSSNIIRF